MLGLKLNHISKNAPGGDTDRGLVVWRSLVMVFEEALYKETSSVGLFQNKKTYQNEVSIAAEMKSSLWSSMFPSTRMDQL